MTFTKQGGKYDLLEVVRTDGSVGRIDCPKQRIIPHDMVHVAVESVLGARGFMRTALANEAVGFELVESVEAEAVERLVETMQADAWSAPGAGDELVDLYRLTCAARGHDAIPVDTAAIEAIRHEMARLTVLWNDLPVGGKLELTF
jgi:hypothetical protein